MAKKSLTNKARAFRCRTKRCAPTGEMKALLSSKLGSGGKSDSKGFVELFQLIDLMKESNVWGGSVKGYLFRGDITSGMKGKIISFAVSNGWQITLGRRIVKYGIIVKGGKLSRRHLLIFGYYREKPSTAYCSLTVI